MSDRIVVDTSAILAVLLKETEAELFLDALEKNDVYFPATVLVEANILALGRGLTRDLTRLIAALDANVVAIDEELAQASILAYRRYGKGRHTASLNFGDCFVYATAKALSCPLLFKGNDFVHTDIKEAVRA